MFGAGAAPANDVTLYTSLPPRLTRHAGGREIGIAYQRECIASWRRLGFDVVSLNSRAEIEALEAHGYNVAFHETDSTPPRINDVLSVIRGSGARIGAIINADCMLFTNGAIVAAMLRAAGTGMVLGERLNLTPDQVRPTGVPFLGFDLFLFSTGPARDINLDDAIVMGSPWWDWWFPLAFQSAGGKLFSLPAPVLLHLDHPQNYSHALSAGNAERMYRYFAGSTVGTGFPFIGERHAANSKEDFYRLSRASHAWLLCTSEKIAISDPASLLLLNFMSGLRNSGMELRLREDLSIARSRPLANAMRYLKWKSSEATLAMKPVLPRKFAARMQRRAEKQSPLGGY
jgi:hypothetical protein